MTAKEFAEILLKHPDFALKIEGFSRDYPFDQGDFHVDEDSKEIVIHWFF